MFVFSALSNWAERKWSWGLLFASAFVLELIALYFQYVMDLKPCIMCIYQRTAVVGVMLAAILPLLANNVFTQCSDAEPMDNHVDLTQDTPEAAPIKKEKETPECEKKVSALDNSVDLTEDAPEGTKKPAAVATRKRKNPEPPTGFLHEDPPQAPPMKRARRNVN